MSDVPLLVAGVAFGGWGGPLVAKARQQQQQQKPLAYFLKLS
jgi:hypothetical protein